MKKNRKSLYRILVPKFIRKWRSNNSIKNQIFGYYDSLPETGISNEEKEALNYLKNNKLCYFPYAFKDKYKTKDISVFFDETIKLNYVLTDGKRLYFKRNSSVNGIKRMYNNLLIEQDLNSPHRYLTDNFTMGANDILVDVGAAEGNLPLSVIEKVKKVYLFETDENWIEALNATFSKWKDKVEIINKFVGDTNEGQFISLEEYFNDKEKFTFLKVDAEGAEEHILNGGQSLLKSYEIVKLCVCCYHRPNDEHKFKEYFLNLGYSVSFSNGYMIYPEPKTFTPPYLRKGLIRAEKKL